VKENSEDPGSGVVAMKLRGVEHIAAIILLLLVAVSAGVLVYMWLTGFTSTGTSATANLETSVKGKAIIEAIKIGPGYIAIYVRGLQGDPYIDTVYLVSPSGALLDVIHLPVRVQVAPGKVSIVYVPLILLGGKIPRTPVYIKLGSSNGIVASTRQPVSLSQALSKLTIGIFVDRDTSSVTTDMVLNVTPGLIQETAMILNPLTGVYRYRYSAGESIYSVPEGSGTTYILTPSNVEKLQSPLRDFVEMNSTTAVIDLNGLYYSVGSAEYNNITYSKFGPFIVVLNPTWGTEPYTVIVYGVNVTGAPTYTNIYKLNPIAKDKYKVAFDILIMYEDMWSPSRSSLLDNYADHVVRVTVFTNNTIAIWLYNCSGYYLHMVFLNPPSFDEIFKIASLYINCSIPGTLLKTDPTVANITNMGGSISDINASGILYIKPHGWATFSSSGSTGLGVYKPYYPGVIITTVPVRIR